MYLNRFFLILSFFAASFSMNAQEIWDLKRCILHAQEQSLDVKQQLISNTRADLYLRQARHARYPSLSAGGNFQFALGRSIDPTSYEFVDDNIQTSNIGLNSSMPLFAWNSINYNIKSAKLGAEATSWDLKQIKDAVALSITLNYVAILHSMENLENANGQLETSEKQLSQIRKLVDAGARPAADALSVEAEMTVKEQTVVSAENQLRNDILNLKQALNLDPEYELQIVRPNVDALLDEGQMDFRAQAIYSHALGTQPGIKSAETRVLASQYMAKAQRAQMFPSVGLTAGINSNWINVAELPTSFGVRRIATPGVYIDGELVNFEIEQPFPQNFQKVSYLDQIDQNLSYGFGFGITIPIYNGLQLKNAYQQSKLDVESLEIESERAKQKLRSDIQTAVSDLKAARKEFEAMKKSLSALEKVFKNVQKKYDLGAANDFELLQAKTDRDQAENFLSISKYQYVLLLKQIDYYLGRGIQF